MSSIYKMTKYGHVKKLWMCRCCIWFLLLLLIVLLVSCCPATYYEVPDARSAPSAPITQVFFYPLRGQTTEQQSRDHYECYNWAVKQTGFDPGQSSIPTQRRVKVVPMPPPGHDTIALSIAGAVLGALIGGPKHAGEGLLIGAGSGALVGAASDTARQRYAEQMEEAYNRSNQALDSRYEAQARNFRRAMSACLEGRDYIVK